MKRTTIVAPDELLGQLRQIAQERGVSRAVLIEALAAKVHSHRPKPHSLGVGDSGRTDVARSTTEERPDARSWR